MKMILCVLSALLGFQIISEEAVLKIPFKPDPPIHVDGELSDWNDVPFSIFLTGKKHLLQAKDIKPIPPDRDFQAKLAFCWKSSGLYLAAKVKDDHFLQKGVGMDIFQGDHLELFLDAAPYEKDAGAKFGKKQYHIGISPGNFSNLKPEIVSAYPAEKIFRESCCASKRTVEGWTAEVFIAWKELEGKNLFRDKVIGLTVWVCDSSADIGTKLKVEHILTTGKPTARFRSRPDLMPAVFTDGNGKHHAVIQQSEPIKIANTIQVDAQKKQEITFTLDKMPGHLTPVLRLNANLQIDRTFAGYSRAMQIFVNGKELNQYNLVTPANDFRTEQGAKSTIYQSGKGYLVPYTKDGKAGNDRTYTQRHFSMHYNMHAFLLDLSGMLKTGKNTIVFRNTNPAKTIWTLQLSEVVLSFENVEKKTSRKPAPTGKLPVIHLKQKFPLNREIAYHDNTIKIPFAHGVYTVESRFSTPDGQWTSGSCPYFKHERKVEREEELLLVSDTFTNLTQENLPLIQEHVLSAPEKNTVLRLCGLEYSSGRNIRHSVGNFSVFAGIQGSSGVGLYAVNTVFQIHFGAFIQAPGSVAMTDRELVLPPGKSITQQFILVPLEKGDYFDFVNVARRWLKTNIQLQGPIGMSALWNKNSGYLNRLNTYNFYYVIGGSGFSHSKGGLGHCMLDNHELRKQEMNLIQDMKKIRPQIKVLRYFHSQIEGDPVVQYKEGKVLLKNGTHAAYGSSKHGNLYLNLENTEFSKIMEKALDDILDNWDVYGIYWDEIISSGVDYHYGQPWDQYSGDIDPQTHRLECLKSSVFLLQLPWKLRMINKIVSRGKFLYANGGHGRISDFAGKVTYTFTETDHEDQNARVHFTTPLSWGNSTHMNSYDPAVYYEKFLRVLDYGCMFNPSSIATPVFAKIYHTVTDYLYPTTPLELHSGYIIAKERIITKKSGLFGWEDDSNHEIHVYDETGREIKKHKMKTVRMNGQNWSEIRLPQDWSAIIIRKTNSEKK